MYHESIEQQETSRIHKTEAKTNIYEYSYLKSTQDFIINNHEELNLANFDIIYTPNQSNGYGRSNNRWFSTEGFLTFSMFMDSNWYREIMNKHRSCECNLCLQERILNLLCFVLENEYKVKPYIKWPNDLYIETSKIGGIIISKIEDKYFVGIGINFKQEIIDDIQYSDIKSLTGIDIDPIIFMSNFVSLLSSEDFNLYTYLYIPNIVNYEGQKCKILSIKCLKLHCETEYKKQIIFDPESFGYSVKENEIFIKK